jgi:hypothetical protein
MLRVWGVAVLGLVLLPARAAADLDPGLTEPYKLHIVLHFADHRLLKDSFRAEVGRQLGDLLRLTFGDLAQVRILSEHPHLKEVLTQGLDQALDGWDELSDTKSHFILIDYVDGQYRLRARQHDGLTGLPSPAVRQEQTPDRRLVPRLAARLVDRDFGLVGTVTSTDEHGAQVAFRGGGLGVPLERWLQPGDVLAITCITQEGSKRRAARLEEALLQVAAKPEEGICRCRYFHRYLADKLQDGPEILGYRCLRLTTITAPLRLRLIDKKTLAPLDGLQVHVSRTGFGSAPAELTSGADGMVVSRDAYPGVAFVQVLSGKKVKVQLPVEIVDDRIVVCRVTIDEEAADKERLGLRHERWLRRLYEELRLADQRVTRLNAMLEKSSEEALKEARAGLQGLSKEIDGLTGEGGELRAAAAKEAPGTLDLGEGDQRLRELRERREQLAQFVRRLDEVIQEAQGEKAKALRTLLERAALLESQADYEEAIRLYQKVLAESPGQANASVRAHLEDLQRAWKLQGPEHAKARQLIYGTWPKKMDTAGMKASLPQAWQALRECQKAGDRLSPKKMLPADLAHASWLKDRLEVLRRTPDREDSRAEAKLILQLAEDLRRLHAEVSTFVKDKTAPK